MLRIGERILAMDSRKFNKSVAITRLMVSNPIVGSRPSTRSMKSTSRLLCSIPVSGPTGSAPQ
jgi:hypothetical protein